MPWKIPLSDIDLTEKEIIDVTKVLKSKWLSMGPVTEKFEKNFSEYLDVKYALATSNGTAALHIAHRALGIGYGDEVIVPSLTFVATANSILYVGAKPIFADISSLDNFNISPEHILEKITPKTKAIVVVHYGGYPADMKAIMEIAEDYNLYLIEDAAHAPGAEYGGRKIGTLGHIGCFSFFANKNLVTGEGGMVVTNNSKLIEKIKQLRSHGMTTLTWARHSGHASTYDVLDLGYNYRINELASMLGLLQLKKLDKNNARRKKIVELYQKKLHKIPNISVPFLNFHEKSSYHIFPILLSNTISRELFMAKLKENGIQTSIHYPPIHLFTYYKQLFGFKKGLLPKTEYVGEHEVTLPLHPLMKIEDVKQIASAINAIF